MDRGGCSAQTLTHETRSIDVIPVATVISDEMRAAVVEARGGAGAQAGPQDRPNQPITGRLVETAGPNGPMYSAHTAVEASRRRSKQDPRDQCVNRRPVAIFFSPAKFGLCLPDHRVDHAVVAHVPNGSDLPRSGCGLYRTPRDRRRTPSSAVARPRNPAP
jgi:hypothetical protein